MFLTKRTSITINKKKGKIRMYLLIHRHLPTLVRGFQEIVLLRVRASTLSRVESDPS